MRVTGTDGSTSPWSTPLSVQLATAPGGFSVRPVSVTDEDVPALLRTELTLRDAPVSNTGTLGAVPFIIPPNARSLIEQGWAELSASR